jgi:hypothetical protein
MSVAESEQLLDLIYEAAAIPELWPSVLDSLARIAGGCRHVFDDHQLP